MRFVIIRKADADTEARMMPSEALVTAMMKYTEDNCDKIGLSA